MTNSGQQIVGAISSVFAGCGAKDFGKHKYHPFPFKWWKKIDPNAENTGRKVQKSRDRH
jgi:hypothetical protein